MKKTSTNSSFEKNIFDKMEYSLFDEEMAILFRNEKFLQPSEASLQIILKHSEKTAKKPNLLLCWLVNKAWDAKGNWLVFVLDKNVQSRVGM